MSSWVVHKFGGTSVGDADRYRNVAAILLGEHGAAGHPDARTCTIVSAMAGVTDALLGLCDDAKQRDGRWREHFSALIAKHRETAEALLSAESARSFGEQLDRDARDLEDLFRATWLMRSAPLEALEYISGHGELWSARMLTALLADRGAAAHMVDAREVLVVQEAEGGPRVLWNKSEALLEECLRRAKGEGPVVVTGYVARREDGTPTTLKRNGSDLSASLFGNLLDARSITIWTDVDGVLTADPRRVPDARVTPALSYAEAAELAYFGAKVLHPHTMAPAIDKRIPIWIKNSLNPDATGSCISHDPDGRTGLPVVGFATVDAVSLVNLEGKGMMGVPGIAERLFRALRDIGVSVTMISQASSEHSICVAVPLVDGPRAEQALRDAFAVEIQQRRIDGASRVEPCAILAAVGDRMAEVPGIAGRLMSALGNAGVNVRAVAQGSSERNISVALDAADVERGLRAVHASFTLSDQTLSLGLVGPGLIGKELLKQVQDQKALLSDRFRIDLRVRAIANSKKMVLADEEIDLNTWEQALEQGVEVDLDAFAAHVGAPHLPHGALLDCTASGAVASHTGDWLERGLHVVTPNKQACAGDLHAYQRIQRLRAASRVHFFYEATVGAGLPILSTLRDLVKTGDTVLSIEGVLSGTLSYLFNTYDGRQPFSALVRHARELGYTEPDPREDLSGMDVARKVVILAREMGLEPSLGDVKVESLIPAGLESAPSADAFLDGLADHDDAMAARFAAAAKEGAVLRFVGRVDPKVGLSVGLTTVAKDHAFARLSGSDNILAFTTGRYKTQPLIVQGPGAGPAVTAAGVFSDVLRLAGHLGARS